MLKDILSISGKPGLYKRISHTSNAIIVESIQDGKRFAAYSNAKMIALEDISIYTEDDDMPLKDVFKRFTDKANGGALPSHKEDASKIVAMFDEVLPEYDRDRVYVSDMRKMIQWYNILAEKNLLDFSEQEEDTKEEESKG